MGLSQEDRLRDELCLAVMEAYFNVLYHTEMTEVLRKQIEVSKASLQLMKKQYELGQKSYPDVAQMEASRTCRQGISIHHIVKQQRRRTSYIKICNDVAS